MGAPGEKTNALPTAALADEILVNSGGTTSRIPALALAAQFASMASVSPTIASIASLGTAAGKMLYTTAPNAWAEWSLTAAARSILDDTSVDAIRATLFIGDFLTVATLITDWNAPTTSGIYMGNAAANGPDGANWYIGSTLVHNANYMVQSVVGFTQFSATNTAKYVRAKFGTAWTPWTRVYQSAAEIYSLTLGGGQTWQNVFGSRVAGTAYQNTTARPIAVALYLRGDAYAQASENGVTWVNVGNFVGTGHMPVNFIVPVGHYYRVSGTRVVYPAYDLWSELR